MMETFDGMNLRPELVHTVTKLGYESPTPVQAAVVPIMLTGRDVIGQAQTGTGKTAAFSLPILNNVDRGNKHVQALILAPTRELAMQVSRAIHEYGQELNTRVLPIYGGQPYDRQIRRLKKGVDIVVGTPGRLLDLIGRGVLDLSQLETLVIDEADEMLTLGFIEDVEAILAVTPAERQTALFSATMPPAIRKLAQKYMREPEHVAIEAQQRTGDLIEELYYLVNEKDKTAALTRLFEVEDIKSALIFTRTRADTGQLANELTSRGFAAEPINGDLSQDARERVLRRFREGKMTVLVATDVAARGLDIDDISHVFNYDLPQFADTYVHRVGRTGRAGRTGKAMTLLTPREMWRLRKIETYTKQKITAAQIPTVEEITTQRAEILEERMMVWLRRGRCAKERETVERLIEEEGYDPVEIAAAALKLAQSEDKKRPIAPMSELMEQKSRNRRNGRSKGSNNRRERGGGGRGKGRRTSHEEGMVRLALDAGKSQGIRPADVVGSIAYHADIPGKSIGSIQINDDYTLVDVPEKFVSKVLSDQTNVRIRKIKVDVKRAS